MINITRNKSSRFEKFIHILYLLLPPKKNTPKKRQQFYPKPRHFLFLKQEMSIPLNIHPVFNLTEIFIPLNKKNTWKIKPKTDATAATFNRGNW